MNITDIANWRYSTKEFDPSKKISEKDFDKIKTLLRMSPSSTNIQPWHFVIANTEGGKERIAKGTQGFYQFNEQKVKDASHVIVFCARTDADDEYMLHLLETEDKDGRYPNDEIKQMVFGARNIFAKMHKYDYKDQQHWMDKQVYMNMGNLLLGVAALGIDALPMEGVDMKALDEEFGLREKGFTAIGVVSLGYRKESDFNMPNKTPKSRLPEEEIITILS
ncbi:oxygen-insensitive NAD(P)H nitroreductase [Ancylomarina euxinus]|uniref:Oxygen-insensitive NAD(P)H nitroreductase n=1 Tax=Ancylomarina euxinus TaxID=2283627 RepID=A0A425XWK1_9BACT|nr:oxygen-insensitive NAD(P)H nitroreductase [Ancylomarina euxinus]MCZ4696402.1 oxygen-insensitive NAD(P)H nitroreductase [Ancylomarina euxinus]RRG19019.1 oxygen-insensitive NAD(P)H nitroreductase [Ancylomarina euxinus]